MKVLLASPRSFCAGVERAIEIVHNTHVVADLRAAGAVFVDELDAVPDGATVVFSAHGVSPTVRAEAARRHLAVVDATCPLVAKVHAEARQLVQLAAAGRAGQPVRHRRAPRRGRR